MTVKNYGAESANYPNHNIYSATVEQLWSPEELSDEKRRRCAACRKVCTDICMRVFESRRVQNYCSKQCFENS